MFDRIIFGPQIMGGRACIRGVRIPVSVIVPHFADGSTFDEVLSECPALEREDLHQALAYAAALARDEVIAS